VTLSAKLVALRDSVVEILLSFVLGPRPPVVAYPIPCTLCRGERDYETIDEGAVPCSYCRGPRGEPTGAERFEFRRAGAHMGSWTVARHDAEEAAECAARASRLNDKRAVELIDREG
jgi:hypothetical protein